MLDFRRPNQLVYSVLVSVILFGITQFLLTYRNLAEVEDEKLTLHERLIAQDHAHQNVQMELQNAKRDVHRLMRRVQEAEKWQKAAQKRSHTSAIDTVSGEKLLLFECIAACSCAPYAYKRRADIRSFL
jgi:low affinity Fe/Cu permease